MLWLAETNSIIAEQRHYRREYGGEEPHGKLVKQWVEQIKETDSVLHRKGAGRPVVSDDAVEHVRGLFLVGLHKGLCLPHLCPEFA